ncbi:TetR/AcrR family transcriptional regulator [Nocardia gipuzkoensis]|uniref:TetR/AcrR family transcriptional regulator n=1 Tax=Nocardia gipuzkoensis TaxID=2749991 RepID=UPI00237EB3BB|nr:TetR/AcrR family transcriptional regulator [Nocardia gipuzkoensis]MDE1675504.1 TetR/AcrR family transcriptional regulator [Nocardia gipuzkoensis]
MAPPVLTPRQAWIDTALAILSESGPDAIRIEAIAAQMGVTRGGFYRQFSGRQELLDAVLDTWERRSIDEVRVRVQQEGGDAKSKIRKAGRLTFSKELLPIDLAVREWARRDSAVAARLRYVDNGRMAYLRDLIGTIRDNPHDIEARSMLAFSLVIADHLIAADHQTGTRAQIIESAARLILGEGASAPL